MMNKQFVLGLCTLLIVSCTSSYDGKNSTLVDMFAWGNEDAENQEIAQNVKVEAKEKFLNQTQGERVVRYADYQYNDNIRVKYVDVEKNNADITDVSPEDIEIKEVIIETENPDKNSQVYTLTKRSERYKNIEDMVSPNVYAIIASRVTDKFLTEIPAFFADKKDVTLYIEKTVLGDRFMPSTPDVAELTVKEIIIGSEMFSLVDDKNKASYILKGRLSNVNTPEVPVFKYELALYDNNNKLIDKWSDIIRQVQNDDGSWW